MLLDTYAWVEFFKGSKKGKKVRNILKEKRCYTNTVSLAELVEWGLKNNFEKKIENFLKGVFEGSVILDVDKEIAIISGKINHERKKKIKWCGMIDSLILATAVSYNLDILTGDTHFKDLPNAEML